MRTIPASALETFQVEAFVVAEISWGDNVSSSFSSSDKILSISPIASVIALDQSNTNSVSITLDDTDDEIKNIINNVDIHKAKLSLYQHYGNEGERFSVFEGDIETPFQWGNNDRQLTFNVTNEVESYEVGFSPEESKLDFVSKDLIGNAWPVGFGHPVHVPATKIKQVPTAKLIEPYGLVDPLLDFKMLQLESDFQFEAFFFTFWQLALQGNDSPLNSEYLLNALVEIIIEEDLALIEVGRATEAVNQAQDFKKADPDNPNRDANLIIARRDLETATNNSQQVWLQKQEIYRLIRLKRFEVEFEQFAAREMLIAYNNMREIYGKYLDLLKQKCNQERFHKSQVLVEDEEDFPQDTFVDIIIKGVKFRGKFNDNLLTIKDNPIPTYTDLDVAGWVPDDEPCGDITDLDGLDLFYLDDETSILEGQWILVEDLNDQEHILKVRRQSGNKVYFDLVEWDKDHNLPEGLDIDKLTKDVVQVAANLGGLFGNVPPEIFQNNLSPDNYNRPEIPQLLVILQRIWEAKEEIGEDQPLIDIISYDELIALVTLIYLLPWDNVSDLIYIPPPNPRDTFTIIGQDVKKVKSVAGIVLRDWLFENVPYEEIPDQVTWFAPSGSDVRLATDACEIYIANILPSNIKAVYAYRTNIDGIHYLAPVPSRYYEKRENENLGDLNVTALVFHRPLTHIPDENWEDEVYVTYESSVGPNVAEIIEHIIDVYLPNHTADSTSFEGAKSIFRHGNLSIVGGNFKADEQDVVTSPIPLSVIGDTDNPPINDFSIEWKMNVATSYDDDATIFSSFGSETSNLSRSSSYYNLTASQRQEVTTDNKFVVLVKRPTLYTTGQIRVATSGPEGTTFDDWTGIPELRDGQEHSYKIVPVTLSHPYRLSLYVDGVKHSSDIQFTSMNRVSFPAYSILIGKGVPADPEYFEGTLRDFRLVVDSFETLNYYFDHTEGDVVIDYAPGAFDADYSTNRPDVDTFWELNNKPGEYYRADFALLDKPDALQEIKRIAWEARCALYLRGNEIIIKYLSQEEDSVLDFDTSNVEASTLQVIFPRTEDIVTLIRASYKTNYLPEEEEKYVVLRHNIINKYGLKKREEFFHIYSNEKLVEKSATFWLIRYANTWKKVTHKTPSTSHAGMALELWDKVKYLTDVGKHFSTSEVIADLEKIIYDYNQDTITIQANTGIKAGEMEPYIHFRPALNPLHEFPTIEEIKKGFAGGLWQGVEGEIEC